MKSRFISTAIVSLILLFALLGFQCADSVHATSKFSIEDIEATIQIISPVNNETCTGDVSLNISVHFHAKSYDFNTSSVIPYQDINCFYQLDNGEWKNASLCFASEQRAFWSWIARVHTTWVDCNYSALLQGLSNGAHFINVTLKPIGSILRGATVKFYVSSNSEQSATTEIVLSLAIISTIIIISTIVVVLRRRKMRQKFQDGTPSARAKKREVICVF